MVNLLIMNQLYKKIKINNYTYLFFILCALCGYLKNILIIYMLIIIHELGHIFFSYIFNYEIVMVEIFPYGGLTITNKRINSNINKDIIINFGGIIFQILFMFIIFLFKNNFNIITYNLIKSYNFIIIFFNLLPIISLDGNNILHLLLEKKFSYSFSYKINFIISLIFLVIFFIYNYLYHIDNYFIILYLFFQSIIYIKNYKYLQKRFLLERYLYDLDYKKINNNTKKISELKKETLHYFKDNMRYLKERKVIEKSIYKFDK